MDAHLRLAYRNYELDPSLENANALIQAYRRSLGSPNNSQFRVSSLIEEKEIRYLLSSALEGGSNYWYYICDVKLAPGLVYEDFREGGRMTIDEYFPATQLIPFVPGCALIILSILDDGVTAFLAEMDEFARSGGEVKWGELNIPSHITSYVLDRDTIWRGLQLMADQHPRVWARFQDEDADADVADLFLQLALFGECRYS